MSTNEEFPVEVARKAYKGNAIYCFPELSVRGEGLTQDLIDAINAVDQNYPAFCNLIKENLKRWPLTRHFFEHLIDSRLKQNAILASDFISRVIDTNNPLEDRLKRIVGKVKNLESITSDVNVPSDPSLGQEADEVLLDLWNEIFVIDFLLNRNEFKYIDLEKVVREKDQPQIDLIGNWNSEAHAIEITRIRKREFSGSTHPTMFDEIYSKENFSSLRNAIKKKMRNKNKQMRKFRSAEEATYLKHLLVIKTSQWEYQDGSIAVKEITQEFLKSGNYPSIDEIVLIYDIERFDWIR